MRIRPSGLGATVSPAGSSALAHSRNGESGTLPPIPQTLGLGARPCSPGGLWWPGSLGMQLMYQTSCLGRHVPTNPICAAHVLNVMGERRCGKGCKVCSQPAHLLLSLQAPVRRWMAQALGHQAPVKEAEVSFSVLLNMLFGINLNSLPVKCG